MKRVPCTGVILAGGLNSRMGGENKALLSVGGRHILDHLMGTVSDRVEETILVTNAPQAFLDWDVMMVSDLFTMRCSLNGIHAGLFHAASSHIFVTACDTPFLKKDVISRLLKGLDPQVDVIIPETEKGLQPLCAVYSKRCLKPIQRQLQKECPRITDFFPFVRVKKIPEDEFRKIDPDLISFFNVNTPQDLELAEEMWGRKSA